jgi:hypothetical protein
MSKSKRRKFGPAVAMGRRGGKARARALTPEQRRAISRKGARVREARRVKSVMLV